MNPPRSLFVLLIAFVLSACQSNPPVSLQECPLPPEQLSETTEELRALNAVNADDAAFIEAVAADYPIAMRNTNALKFCKAWIKANGPQ